MAIISTYPTVFPEANDILLGTEKNATLRNPTKNFLVNDLARFIINTFNGKSLTLPLFLDTTDPITGIKYSELKDSIISHFMISGGNR